MPNPWLQGDPEPVLVADGVALSGALSGAGAEVLAAGAAEVLAAGAADAVGVAAGW